MKNKIFVLISGLLIFCCILFGFISCEENNSLNNENTASAFNGNWIEGMGNTETLKLIDQAFESMQPSSQMANLPLL
ncbi:MAG: hypothetical protein KAI29_21535, partial [Cyclobacteriaceae bacterium]|nr:hypothetical protein [Cyclobacteriaceae bacterium]